MKTTTLLLIRHGQTDWNRQGRYTGQSDIPINEMGREQARLLASKLKTTPPDVIYASDLIRAYQTAEIVAGACDVPLYADPRLREINQGVWEGMLFADIKARFAREFAARKADPLTVAAPEGETVGQVRERVLAAVQTIIEKHPGQRVAIVAHGLVLAIIKGYVIDHPITKVWDLIPPNAEAEEVEVKAITVSSS